MSDFDLIVVGGGVVGLSIAFEATRRGHRTAVLCTDSAGVATTASAGMLAPACEAREAEEPLIEMALESCQTYPDFVGALETITGLSCGYRREGTLLVALHRDHTDEIEHLMGAQQRLGLTARWLSAQDVRRKEPHLTPRQVGALYSADDGQVDPRKLVAALRAAIVHLGSHLFAGTAACALRYEGSRVCGVVASDGGPELELKANVVVIAAGVWSNQILAEIPVLPLRPVKGQGVRLIGDALIERVVRTPDVYIVPRSNHELYVGASSEEVGLEAESTAGPVMDLLREAWRVLPGIYELEVAELVVGFRPAIRDLLPAIGPTEIEGLHVATGHYRHGVMLAPATARLLCDAIDGKDVDAQLRRFSPRRFQ